MQEIIIAETRKIFTKCIKRYAQKMKIEENEISLLLFLKEDDKRKVGYKICKHHIPDSEIGIMDVLGVKIDLKMYSQLVPPYIKKILENFETELSGGKIEVCVYLDREDEEDVQYFVYKDEKFVKPFDLADVLNFEVT